MNAPVSQDASNGRQEASSNASAHARPDNAAWSYVRLAPKEKNKQFAYFVTNASRGEGITILKEHLVGWKVTLQNVQKFMQMWILNDNKEEERERESAKGNKFRDWYPT